MITSDPRPAIWAAYLELAGRAPWLGVGLGRGVPSRAYHLEAAAVALVLAMLVKNSTNDLIVFGNAILFWALMGTMLGLVWRRGDERADRADTVLLPESLQGKK